MRIPKVICTSGLAGARRDVFQEVGGFDESLPDAFADIGLCLKVRRAGYLIVYTPFAKLYKHETRTAIGRDRNG
jgi:O-antigen biosynthesis protein